MKRKNCTHKKCTQYTCMLGMDTQEVYTCILGMDTQVCNVPITHALKEDYMHADTVMHITVPHMHSTRGAHIYTGMHYVCIQSRTHIMGMHVNIVKCTYGNALCVHTGVHMYGNAAYTCTAMH